MNTILRDGVFVSIGFKRITLFASAVGQRTAIFYFCRFSCTQSQTIHI